MEYTLVDLNNLLARLVEETNARKNENTNSFRFMPSDDKNCIATLHLAINDADLSDLVRKQIRTYVFRKELLYQAKIVPVSEIRLTVCGNVETKQFNGLPSSRFDDVYVDFYRKKD